MPSSTPAPDWPTDTPANRAAGAERPTAWWARPIRHLAYAWTTITTLVAIWWFLVAVTGNAGGGDGSGLHLASYALGAVVALGVAQLAGGWLGVAALVHRRHHGLPLP